MNVSPKQQHKEFIQKQVDSGQFGCSDEVVEAALELLKERERKREGAIEDLRREINIGLEQSARGESIPLSADEIKRKGREELEARREKADCA